MPFQSWVRTAAFAATVMLPFHAVLSQTKPGGAAGAASNTGITTPGSATPTTSTTGANTSTSGNSTPAAQAPTFISGRVMVDDGAPPPEPAAIERVCMSVTRTEGYTDSKGYFAVELGNERGIYQDASEDTTHSIRVLTGGSAAATTSSGIAPVNNAGAADRRFMNCEIRARLAGYRSQSISLSTHRAMDTPDIGVILLHRQGKDEGTTISMASLAAPREAKKAYEKGMNALKKNNTAEAEKDFQAAVDAYPKYAVAWTELGKIQVARNELVDARHSFDQAVLADPRFLGPFLQITLLAAQARKWDELAQVTDRAMRLDPFEYPQIYLFNGVANYNLKKYALSERSIEAAAKLDTLQQLPAVSHLQGLLCMQRHDYVCAADRLRTYLRLAPGAEDAQEVRTQLAQAEKLVADNRSAPDPAKQDDPMPIK